MNSEELDVDLSASPANLIQSELFGYELGAFTGADERRIGRLEGADGATLLLDEVSELPVEIQGNLLRFLQEKTVQRLGSPLARNISRAAKEARHSARDPASHAGALAC